VAEGARLESVYTLIRIMGSNPILSAIRKGPTAPVGYEDQRRAPPHCGVVNLVRSGRKQPQLLTASAGDKARHHTR
jgi:hypothetical protein